MFYTRQQALSLLLAQLHKVREGQTKLVDVITSAIADFLVRSERTTLVVFGALEVRRRRVGTEVNPWTREN